MYVESLRLENVKCFEDVTLQFRTRQQTGDPQSNWHVILGHNGDGKTTLLQAIAACLMDATTADRLLRPSTWVRGKHKVAELSASIRSCEDDHAAVGRPRREEVSSRQVRYAVIAGGTEQTGRFFPTTTIVDPGVVSDVFGADSEKVNRDLDFMRRNAYAPREHAGWISCGYGAFRRVYGFASETVSIVEPLQRRFLTLFEEGAALYDCESWLRELDRRAAKSRTDSPQRRTLANVKRVLLKLLPDVESIEIKDDVVFRWRSGDVGVGQLSDGYRSMFALATDLLRWLEMLHSRTVALDQCTGVVLIDEIDAHLHPSWQRKAGFLLTEVFPNLQFIVTSHSPFVAMASGKNALTLLEKEGESVTARQDVPYVRGWAVDQILTELFGLVSLRDPETERGMADYEALRLKRRGDGLSEEEEQELRRLEIELNERLRGEPTSPRERQFGEDLAYFTALAQAGESKR